MRRLPLVLLVALLCVCFARRAAAQDEPSTTPAESDLPVAARVNGQPIYVGEVELAMSRVAKNGRLKPEMLDAARADVLRQTIRRRVAQQALIREGEYVKPAELAKALDPLDTQVRQRGMTLESYAKSLGVTLDAMKADVSWELAWSRYLERHQADALERLFKKHHRVLDGTQVRASHILLRPERFNDTTELLLERAAKLRKEIDSGKITFEEAAAKYSAGPSRNNGGDIGYFPRFGLMQEDFAKTAFALEKGELSQPVGSNFGVHLIRVSDEKPGTRQWTEVIPAIKTIAAKELLEELVAEELKTAKIEYTGKSPYFDAEAKELVLPGGKRIALPTGKQPTTTDR